tara:strand:- start:1626 stop:3041 length:1416 start_codon:yes stop_codon:yes gene_type:complete
MKLLITSVPWTDTEAPLMAPALLKAQCIQKGIDTTAIDLNQEVLQFVEKNFSNQFKDIQSSLIQNHHDSDPLVVAQIVQFMSDRIMQYKPTHLTLSLLTYASQFICEWLCFYFKLHYPEVKIIIGGPGVFNTLGTQQGFGDRLLQESQIDFFVKGDGDDLLAQLVLENDSSLPGVNKLDWQQLDSLDGRPYPMYDDYAWQLYDNQVIGVVGSRGCVRKCSFCDIHEHWHKFQWRTAQDIFDELCFHVKKTGVTKFKFQDSLINGNQNEFMKLMKLLSKYNKEHPNDKIQWSSFFIFRPKKQMQDEDWELISHSVYFLTVGVESLVDEVRMHMRKKFTNDDLNYCLDKCKQYKIPIGMLLIVGYVTDTHETHRQTIKWFDEHKRYANDPIKYVSFGGGLGILPGTELFRRQKEFGIVLTDVNFDHHWESIDGKNNHHTRMAWMKEQKQACISAGFVEKSQTDNHLIMETEMR